MPGELIGELYAQAYANGTAVVLLATLAATLLCTGAFVAIESYRVGRADGRGEGMAKPKVRRDDLD